MKTIFNAKSTLMATAISAIVLTGCGGGGTSDYSPPPSTESSSTQQLTGSAVKGPIANADISIYELDPSQPGSKGALIASGKTDSSAAMSGVVLPDSVTDADDFLEKLFVIEATGGSEVGSNLTPIIGNLRGVITGLDYSRDQPAYMTPLTTLALDLAAIMKLNNPTVEFSRLLSGSGLEIDGVVSLTAEQTVKTAFGLSLIDKVNLFRDAPLLLANADSQKTLNYRIALETFGAIVQTLKDASGGTDANTLIASLADDLSDGSIDGSGNGGNIPLLSGIANLSALVTADPDDLFIPGSTTRKIPELSNVIYEEAAMTAPGLDVASFPKPVVDDIKKPLASIKDTDGDGVPDGADLFPFNRFESADTDGDCGVIPAPALQDGKTGKGCGDNSDWAPNDGLVKSYCDAGSLSDGDTGNVVDNATKTAAGCFEDSDNDGVVNYDDLFKNNILEWEDTDNDCSGDPDLPTAGNDCGDNSDFDICYSVYIDGDVGLPGDENATTAHGVGRGWLDTSSGILKAVIVQRAEIRDAFGEILPNGDYPILADGIIRTDYNVDINDLAGAQSIKFQRDCVNMAPEDKVDACVVLATGDTYEKNSQVGVANGSYSIAGDFSEIRFTTNFTLIANVVSKHLLVEESRDAGGVTACDIADLPQSSATSIPQDYTLPL